MNFKLNFVIYLTIIALISARAEEEDERMSAKDVAEALMSFGEECDPQPEEEHALEVVKNVEDAQYATKCFRHCLLTQFEMISEGSQVIESEKMADMMGAMFPGRKDDLVQIINGCNEKNKEIMDKCENAHAHGICIFKQMKESDFDMPDFKD